MHTAFGRSDLTSVKGRINRRARCAHSTTVCELHASETLWRTTKAALILVPRAKHYQERRSARQGWNLAL